MNALPLKQIIPWALVLGGFTAVVFPAWAAPPTGLTPSFQSPYVIPAASKDGRSHWPLGGQTQYLADPTGKLTLEEVRHPSRGVLWQTNNADTLNLGGEKNTVHWFRWNLRPSEGAGTLLLDTGTVWMAQAQVYLLDGDRVMKTQHTGMDVPRNRRAYPDDRAVFPLELPPGKPLQVYLRVQSVFALLLIPRLVDPTTLHGDLTLRAMTSGAYMGLIGVMLVYNLILGLFLRDRKYWWYVGYSLAFGICGSVMSGAGHGVLLTHPGPAQSQGLGWVLVVSGFSIALLGLQFSREFFEIPQNAPRLNRWLTLWQVLGVLGLAASAGLGLGVGLFATDMFLLPTQLLIFGVAVWFWLQKARAARYFVIAQVPELLGVVVVVLAYVGQLPPNTLTLRGLEWGSALEIILFSLALADRYTLIRQEKEAALQSALTHESLAVKRLQENKELRRVNLMAEKAREKAESATALKDKFVSLVAHDMRSPFSSILVFAQTLEESQDPPLPPHQRELAAGILTRGRQVVLMVDELLTLNRLQTGKITPEVMPFSPRMMVDEVFLLKHLADEKGIRLENRVADGLVWHGDQRLLYQVIQNLVTNAIKFCRPGDTVTVFSPDDQTLSVRDTGVGIEPAFLPNLFNPEVKTTAPGTAGEPGTGMGLPLCHEIIAVHKGRLWVEPNPGGGSVFSFTLPPTPTT